MTYPEKNAAPEEKRFKRSRPYIMLGLIVVVLLIYFFVPSVNQAVKRMLTPLTSGRVDAVIEYLRSYQGYAALVSAALMVLSSVLAPIPAFLITLSNSVIFGWWKGALLSWSSAMLGAALCFWISRWLGRNAAEKLAGQTVLRGVEQYFEKYGPKTILICRLLPFVSFDAVSYFAGLTPMKFWPFFLATGLGQMPATIVYSYVGGQLSGGAQKLFIGLLTLFALGIFVTILRGLWQAGNRRDKAKIASKEVGRTPESGESTKISASSKLSESLKISGGPETSERHKLSESHEDLKTCTHGEAPAHTEIDLAMRDAAAKPAHNEAAANAEISLRDKSDEQR